MDFCGPIKPNSYEKNIYSFYLFDSGKNGCILYKKILKYFRAFKRFKARFQ